MSDAAGEADRRKVQRKPLRVKADVILAAGQSYEVRTIDISAEGVGIVASANPRLGTPFDLRFSIPLKPTGSAAVAARAKVIHSVLSRDEAGFKIGLKFVSPDAQLTAAIRQFLA